MSIRQRLFTNLRQPPPFGGRQKGIAGRIASPRGVVAARLVMVSASITCIAVLPLLFQRFAHVDPAVVSAMGYPAVFLVNLVGSMTLFLPVPGLAVAFAGGGIMNPFFVATVASTGMALGMVWCYVLGVSGSPFIQKLAASSNSVAANVVRRIQGWFQRYGVWAAFLLAAVPNPFFDFAGLWAGAIRMPLWKFAVGTFLGKVLQTSIMALAGRYFAGALGLAP